MGEEKKEKKKRNIYLNQDEKKKMMFGWRKCREKKWINGVTGCGYERGRKMDDGGYHR